MILYHGSNTEVSKIDLNRCRPYKDFGKGFYLTDIKKQAESMAIKVARIYGGEATVSVFELDEEIYNDKNIKSLTFKNTDKEWAEFIINNRLEDALPETILRSNQDNKYDLVYGPVADDDIHYLIWAFWESIINTDQLAERLTYKYLSSQYSFHTERAISYLTFKEKYYGYPSKT
jgi:hypothetical protein